MPRADWAVERSIAVSAVPGQGVVVWRIGEPWSQRKDSPVEMAELALSPTADYLAGRTADGNLYVWPTPHPMALESKPVLSGLLWPTLLPPTFRPVKFSPDGSALYVVDFGVMTDTDRQNLLTSLHGGPSELAPAFKDESKTRIIAVVSGKGGVGKSTVAVNLAAALDRAGHSVEILDADVHGSSIPVMLGSLQKPNVVDGVIFPIESDQGLKFISMGNFVNEGQAIIWRAPIVNKALTQLMRDVYWDEPEFIIVDMPPGTGDVALTVAQMIPKAEALVVTTPQADAARVAVKAGKMAVQAHLKLAGVVENMGYAQCPDCGKELRIFGGDGGERVAGELGSRVIGRIPILPDASGEPGRSLFEVDSSPARVFDEMAAALAATKVRRRIKVL